MNGRLRRSQKDMFQTLYKAIASINGTDEAALFLSDLLSIVEIENISQRIEVAKLLRHGYSYKEINSKIGASSVTIGRVKRALEYGEGGYELILSKLNDENSSIESD